MLSLTQSELTRHISRHAGFQQSGELETSEQNAIDDAIRMGLRWFYFNDHNWSFLKVKATVTIDPEQGWEYLPESFVRITSPVTVSGGKQPLEQVNSESLQVSRDNEQAKGLPKIYAIETDRPNVDTRYTIGIYPLSQDSSVLSFWYLHDPGLPTEGIPPRGGSLHSDCIISACIAAIDRILSPERETSLATFEMFQQKLAKSVELDLEVSGSR